VASTTSAMAAVPDRLGLPAWLPTVLSIPLSVTSRS